jgi:uncharacterized protein
MKRPFESWLRYVVVVFAISWPLQGWVAIRGGIDSAAFKRLAPVIMFVPALVAFAFMLRRRNTFQWRPRKLHYFVAGAILPALIAVICSSIIQTAGIATSERLRSQGGRMIVGHRIFVLGSGDQSIPFFALNLVASALVFAPLAGLLAFGEELGWRGFLQGELVSRFGLARGVTMLGLVWAYWHLPLVLIGYNYPQSPLLGGLILMPLVGIGISFFLAGLTIPSGSFWPAVLAHGSINAFFGVLVYGLDFVRPRLAGDAVVIIGTSVLGVIGWWLLRPTQGGVAP